MDPANITLLLLLFAIIMFVWERVPLAVTAMIVCVSLVLTGVLDAVTGDGPSQRQEDAIADLRLALRRR